MSRVLEQALDQAAADLNLVAVAAEARERRVAWTLEDAQALVLELWDDLERAGWHLGITGGVLRSGASHKDLDLIAYPRSTARSSRRALRSVLRSRGWTLRHNAARMHRRWARNGSDDRKHVEVWQTRRGARVDLFILGDS